MNARSLYVVLTFSLVMSMIITVISIVFAVVLPMVDEPLLTTWPLWIDADQYESVLSTAPNAPWTIEQNQGLLSVETTALGLGLSRALNILLVGGIVVTIIWCLRQVVRDVHNERPFNLTSAQQLKKAGFLLMVLPLWLFFESIIRFYLFVPNATDISEFKLTHIRLLLEGDTGMYIYPDFNLGFLIAGLFILTVAEAFRVGLDLQRDSDEII